jgi:hypothetical protein
MATLDKEELAAIVARDVPGYRLVEKDLVDHVIEEADAKAPGIEVLRRKYLGKGKAASDATAGDNPGHTADAPDDQIVIVEPKESNGVRPAGARPKTVVVSGTKKRVIGYQG